MSWSDVVAAVCLVVLGGFQVFDSAHASVTGQYLTPRSGPHAGRLGPWARVVEALGLAPQAPAVRLWFAVTGLVQLAAAAHLVLSGPHASAVAVGAAALSVWYVPWGTVLALAVLVSVLGPAL